MPLETTAEKPVPVRTVAHLIGQWIARLGRVWVEGQVTQVTRRPGASTIFVTLRDPIADVSLQVTCSRALFDDVVPPVEDGSRIVVFGRPSFYVPRGSVSFAAEAIRTVGLGELLARLEHLRRVLAAEGLFDARRKRPLPFLPHRVGLICGRASAAERDVLTNARRRWPAVEFDVREVAVQGPYAVSEILDALASLDADPEIEVIVLARGGGSVEDLLPFSDETLVRAVASARTPVVSAIGHEQDNPLVDFVADVRASTPTDAAKLVVPDVAEQQALIDGLARRARRAVESRLTREEAVLAGLCSRPVLADPAAGLRRHAQQVDDLRDRARRCLRHLLDRATDDLQHRQERVRALSPAATLERGYAIVQRADGSVLRDPAEATAGEALALRLAGGTLVATAAAEGSAAH
ncbi:exodeoxyribonuclease VII large subunit [Sporichthya polymorpha]|uniref:exodeoxyribonuclease VII large subunit n=1 Tax=Sporichthya polymorpha TaxID=35751 RepID=UPI00037457C8|nr:exodeoxyribonuclease VII large subunit [Sporichthya polymorpha]